MKNLSTAKLTNVILRKKDMNMNVLFFLHPPLQILLHILLIIGNNMPVLNGDLVRAHPRHRLQLDAQLPHPVTYTLLLPSLTVICGSKIVSNCFLMTAIRSSCVMSWNGCHFGNGLSLFRFMADVDVFNLVKPPREASQTVHALDVLFCTGWIFGVSL